MFIFLFCLFLLYSFCVHNFDFFLIYRKKYKAQQNAMKYQKQKQNLFSNFQLFLLAIRFMKIIRQARHKSRHKTILVYCSVVFLVYITTVYLRVVHTSHCSTVYHGGFTKKIFKQLDEQRIHIFDSWME